VTIQVNGVAVPTSMVNRGEYIFSPPPVVRVNGQGDAVTAGLESLEWTWAYVTPTEFAYWYTTLGAGAGSARCSSNRLWDETGTETAFSSCVVMRPTWEAFTGNIYKGFKVKIEQIAT
jgi:hypothetical protein